MTSRRWIRILTGSVLTVLFACIGVVGNIAPAHATMPNFQLPFTCGEVWHASTYSNHGAVDWNAYPNDDGRTVVASAAGTASIGQQFYDNGTGWGYYVIIDHGNGWQTRYAHLKQSGRVSGPVQQGTPIGYVGNSGTSSAHLHWEQILNGTRQGAQYVNGAPVSTGTSYTSSDPSYTNMNCGGSGSGEQSDLAWHQSGSIFTFAGLGLPTTGTSSGFGAPTWAGVGSYNGDNKDDLFWYHGGTDGSIYVLGSTGTQFTSNGRVRGPGVGAPTWAGVGDFDGDGTKDDIAWLQGSTLFTFAGQGLPTTGSVNGIGSPTWAGVGDYNHDGKDDLFWYHGGTDGSIYVLQSTGTSFSSIGSVRGPGVGAPTWAGVGDFDGDGWQDDLAWYQSENIFLFSGAGLSTIGTSTGFGAPTWAGVGSYNGDGKDDLFWYHGGSDGSIYVLGSTGTQFTSNGRVRGPGIGAPTWAGAGDFDGS